MLMFCALLMDYFVQCLFLVAFFLFTLYSSVLYLFNWLSYEKEKKKRKAGYHLKQLLSACGLLTIGLITKVE